MRYRQAVRRGREEKRASIYYSLVIIQSYCRLLNNGGPDDDPDPLNYLSKCHDLHPLSSTDILATFRTVLPGTARDWWEIARTKVVSWSQFETVFLAAFLSEDYEDELAERVRTRSQKENEPIRDVAFSYRALCKKWNPSLTEASIVKMLLKNIKPFIASQLRGRVENVDDLIRLGHQLEKDHGQQQEYNKRMSVKTVNPFPKPNPSSQPVDKPHHFVVCWRGQGNHAPGSCPQYSSPGTSPNPYRQQAPKAPQRFSKQRGVPGNGSVSVVKSKKKNDQPPPKSRKSRMCQIPLLQAISWYLF